MLCIGMCECVRGMTEREREIEIEIDSENLCIFQPAV